MKLPVLLNRRQRRGGQMQSANIANFEVFHGAVWGGHRDTSPHAKSEAESQATFIRGMLDMPTLKDTRNPAELLLSLAIHVIILAVVLIVPLVFTQVLDPHALESVFLVAPLPPAAPPPPAAAQIVRSSRPLAPAVGLAKLTAPAVIPVKVKIVADEAAPPEIGGVSGGVPGGVSGGVLGGVIGGIADAPKPIAPPAAPQRTILRVGGNVKEPVPISTPQPSYPPVARAAHVEGLVVIDAMIDEQGNVVQAKVLAGPSLLIQAALQAVANWRYQPTYLNGQAVALRTHIEVNFRLQ